MQKKIIALAVAGLVSGAAFAQTNVTVYGTMDATFDVVKNNGKDAGGATLEPNHNRITANSSFLGFKGTEDLGNGLKAVFQIEGGLANDAGGGWTGTSRDTYVGLAGGFGTVVAGTLTGPTRALGAALDVHSGATGIGANSGIIGKFGGTLQGATTNANGDLTSTACGRSAAACASPFDTRWKNTIAYISPNFSGLTVVAAYVANENKDDDTVAGGARTKVNTYGYDLGARYENGPVMVGLTYNKANVNNDAAILGLTDIEASDLRLGGSYNFGVVKVNALFDRVKVSGTGYSESQKVWGLGAQVPVGAGKIVGQYYRAKDISGTSDTGAKLYSIGYEHSLSKRTILKAYYAKLDNDNNASYQFGVSPTEANAGSASSGFQMGIRHSF